MSRPSRPSVFLTVALTLTLTVGQWVTDRTLAQDASAAASRSVLDGVFTSDQATRGAKQFQQICTACHTAGEHTGRNFESKRVGSTIGDLFDVVSTTMPDGDPGSLKPEEYASIIAFFLSETGYKPGEKELPAELESLKKIRIEPVPKP